MFLLPPGGLAFLSSKYCAWHLVSCCQSKHLDIVTNSQTPPSHFFIVKLLVPLCCIDSRCNWKPYVSTLIFLLIQHLTSPLFPDFTGWENGGLGGLSLAQGHMVGYKPSSAPNPRTLGLRHPGHSAWSEVMCYFFTHYYAKRAEAPRTKLVS